MICDSWAVVVVPFPFAERAGTKRRPALVLSRRSFNHAAAHTLLAMITSIAHAPWPGDTAIADLAGTGLSVPCLVRLKLFTLDNRLLVRQLGSLSAVDLDLVATRLHTVLL